MEPCSASEASQKLSKPEILIPSEVLTLLPKDLECLYQDSRFKPKDKEYSLFFSEDNLFTTDGILYIKLLKAKALSEAIGNLKVSFPLKFIKSVVKAEVSIKHDEDFFFSIEEPWAFELSLPAEENTYREAPSLIQSYKPDVDILLPRAPFIESLTLIARQVDRTRNLGVLSFSQTNVNVIGLNGDIEDWSSLDEKSVSQQVILESLDLKTLPEAVSIHINVKYLLRILKTSPKKEKFRCQFYSSVPPAGQVPFLAIDDKYFLIPYTQI